MIVSPRRGRAAISDHVSEIWVLVVLLCSARLASRRRRAAGRLAAAAALLALLHCHAIERVRQVKMASDRMTGRP